MKAPFARRKVPVRHWFPAFALFCVLQQAAWITHNWGFVAALAVVAIVNMVLIWQAR